MYPARDSHDEMVAAARRYSGTVLEDEDELLWSLILILAPTREYSPRMLLHCILFEHWREALVFDTPGRSVSPPYEARSESF